MGQQPNKYHVSDDGKVYRVNDDGSFTEMGNVNDLQNENSVNNTSANQPDKLYTPEAVKCVDDNDSWLKRNYVLLAGLIGGIGVCMFASGIDFSRQVLAFGMYFGFLAVLMFIKLRSIQKKLDEEFAQNPQFAEPDDDADDITLRTVFGFGNIFSGKFRKYRINNQNSYVTYYSKMYFLFIIPDTPYRVISTSGFWDTKKSWKVIGTEYEDPREKTCVKYRFYAIWSAGISFMLLLFAYRLI